MRHSLAQLLATSSDRRSPRSPAAACSFPRSGSGRGSPGEAGGEAEPRHDEEAALLAASLLEEDPDEDDGSDELLFPAGLELDDWLEEAAAAETRPDWEMSGGEEGQGEGQGGPTTASEPPSASSTRPLARPGSSRLKAAAAARLNRQKKKQYVTGLESRLQGLAAENRQLRDRNRGLCRRLRDLERETGYLRAVLANQSALGRLLSHLAGAEGGGRAGLRVGSSLFQHRAAAAAVETTSFACESNGSSDHDYALPVPVQEEDKWGAASPSPSPGGICLHVDRDRVSVEFCSVCARRAAGSVLADASAAAAAVSSSFASKIFSFRCLPCQAPLCRG